MFNNTTKYFILVHDLFSYSEFVLWNVTVLWRKPVCRTRHGDVHTGATVVTWQLNSHEPAVLLKWARQQHNTHFKLFKPDLFLRISMNWNDPRPCCTCTISFFADQRLFYRHHHVVCGGLSHHVHLTGNLFITTCETRRIAAGCVFHWTRISSVCCKQMLCSLLPTQLYMFSS